MAEMAKGKPEGIIGGPRSSDRRLLVHVESAIIALLFLTCAFTVVGTNSVAAEQDGDYTYVVSEGLATITGYTGAGGAITIPSTLGGYPVVAIGTEAFSYCSALTSVIIPPDSITAIGEYAFYQCDALSSVAIGNGVATIGEGAFARCGLASVAIPNSVTTIGYAAFYGCYALTSVTIGNGVAAIGDCVFYYCSVLTSIDVSVDNPNYASIGGVLYEEGITTLVAYPPGRSGGVFTMPSSVTIIGNGAFYYCSELTSVPMPSHVVTIGNSAFEHCSGLSSVSIPDSTTTIGNSAFRYCSALTSLSIGNSVTTIGGYAFYYCSLLPSVVIPGSVMTFGAYAFEGCDALVTVSIGNGVTTIGYRAFYHCSALSSVIIPSSVTTIGDYAFYCCSVLTLGTIGECVTTIGYAAFYGCSALTSVIIPDSVTTIGSSVFAYCIALASVTIGDGVTTIGSYAFCGCTALASMTIPGSVTSIGAGAFYDCTALTSLKFYGHDPPTVGPDWIVNTAPGIVGHAYEDSTFPAPGQYFNGLLMGEFIYDYVWTVSDGVATITGYIGPGGDITIPSILGGYPVVAIGDSAFNMCWDITSVIIPDSVITIGDYAFYDCPALTSVAIGNGVITIGAFAFSWCPLASAIIGESVATIGEGAFGQCDLTSVTLPYSVETIGDYAFYYCSALTSITFYGQYTPSYVGICWIDGTPPGIRGHAYFDSYFPAPGEYFYELLMGQYIGTAGDFIYSVSDSVATLTAYIGSGGSATIPSTYEGYPVVAIGDEAFYECSALTSVTIPDSVTSIGYAAFALTALTSVTIPNSVTSIGPGAFAYTALTSVTIGNGVTTIGEAAFAYTALTSVTIPNSVTSIGPGAFAYTALTSVTIGNNVTTIWDYAFAYCAALTSVSFWGLTAPTSVGNSWIEGAAAGIQGHAYEDSNFPAPGQYFNGLLMGEFIPPSEGFDLHLQPGWCFVTVPPVGYGYTASTLGAIVDQVAKWDPVAGYIIWWSLFPTKNNFAIEGSTGYWVLATAPGTLTLLGDIPTTTQTRTITVPTGGAWVMMGFNSLRTDWTATSVVGMYTGGTVQQVAKWDPVAGYTIWWDMFPTKNNFALVPGQSYWILVTASGTLSYTP